MIRPEVRLSDLLRRQGGIELVAFKRNRTMLPLALLLAFAAAFIALAVL